MAEKSVQGSLGHRLAVFFALSFWVMGLLVMSSWWLLDLVLLPFRPYLALGMLAFKLALLAVPLSVPPPAFIKRFLRFSMVAAGEYFPVTVVWEGEREDYEQGPFVIGYEPHSVLPQGICIFCPYATDAVPPGLKDTRLLASSAGFWAPVMRHMWWWLGARPVSRHVFQGLLKKGRSVAVCPGGVKECIYMQEGMEVAYLRKRRGFVRLALQQGAPLIPVFAFGQTQLYKYCRLGYDWPTRMVPRAQWGSFVRRIGYVPMLIWGWMGSFLPRQVPMYIVVGRPLKVPTIEQPTDAQVDEHLQQFIAAIERIFAEHKKAAGQEGMQLTIY